MDAISEEELDTLLAERDPIDAMRVAALPLGPRLTAVLDEILRSPADLDSATREDPRASRDRRARRGGGRLGWTRRGRFAAGSAVAAIAAAGSLVGSGVLGSGTSTVAWLPSFDAAPAQAAELNRLAAAALSRGGPGKGQWLFMRYDVSEGTGTAVGNRQVNVRDHRIVQEWISANDVQRTRSIYRSFSFDTRKDRENFYGPDHKQFVGTGGLPGAPGSGSHVTDEADPSLGASPLAAQNMPQTRLGLLHRFHVLFDRDPTGYTKLPAAQQEVQFSNNFFGELATILADSTSGRQRAAALSDFGYVKGVQMLGTAHDSRGRSGIEIRYVWHGGGGQVNTLIIDPKTGDLLEQTMSELRASFPGEQGPIFPIADGEQRTTYLQRAIVGSMSALPGGRSQPYHGPPPRIAKGSK
jgi:hypothetical protein